MKKILLFTVLYIIIAVSSFAQQSNSGGGAHDTIVLLNGTIIDAKLEEITPTEIKYRRAENLTGPLYTINKSDVLSIRYGNGTVEVINAAAPPKAANTPRLDPKKLYVGVSFEPSGFISGGPSLTVDFQKGALNWTVHACFPTLALNSTVDGFGFGAGAGINYFWAGRIGGFYLGISLEWNMFPSSQIATNYYAIYDHVTDSFSSRNYKEKISVHNIVLAPTAGYKFILGNGLYFRTGISAGVQLSTLLPPGFYYKPDIAAGYMF